MFSRVLAVRLLRFCFPFGTFWCKSVSFQGKRSFFPPGGKTFLGMLLLWRTTSMAFWCLPSHPLKHPCQAKPTTHQHTEQGSGLHVFWCVQAVFKNMTHKITISFVLYTNRFPKIFTKNTSVCNSTWGLHRSVQVFRKCGILVDVVFLKLVLKLKLLSPSSFKTEMFNFHVLSGSPLY